MHLCGIADATGVRSATDTGKAVDRSGSTTYDAPAPRRGLATVPTEAGAITTAYIMKTSLLSAMMIPAKEV